MKTLVHSGVPVLTEDGKGYTVMEGYNIPPIMFTENEANALITAKQIILKNTDSSFVKEYMGAVTKIKVILNNTLKDKVNLLEKRVFFWQKKSAEVKSDNLSPLQFAITNFRIMIIVYSDKDDKITNRAIEPFALISSQQNWLLLSRCRLRKSFRFFRLERIKKLEILAEKFQPHQITLQEYFELYY